MEVKDFGNQNAFPWNNNFWGNNFNYNQWQPKGGCHIEAGDIRDPNPASYAFGHNPSQKPTTPQGENFWQKFVSLMGKNPKNTGGPTTPPPTTQPPTTQPPPTQPPSTQPPSTQPPSNQPPSTQPPSTQPPSTPPPGGYAHNLQEAEAKTHPQFKPILRGDETELDSQIHDQASFGRAVDLVAKEYGLDPNMFRAQLEKESGAFSQGYEKAMHLEGDLGRKGDNNTSIGLGQISRKFLDGREWSNGGPNDPRVGGKTVTTEQYNNSVIVQLRVAAANSAMRIKDHGGVEPGLLYYVSGHTTKDAQNADYVDSINRLMQDDKLMNIGR